MSELPETIELSPETAVEAPLEPIETHPETSSFEELVSALYAGKSAKHGNYTVEGGVLFETSGGDVHAIADHGGVICSYTTLTTSLNDALMFQAGANGFEMARVHRPDQPDYRLSDLRGKSKAGRIAAKVLQIPIDVDAFEALLEERERINNQIAELETAVLTTPRAIAIQEMMAERLKQIEAAKYEDGNKRWDAGDSVSSNHVRGADGNNQRLRIVPGDPYSVQGSGGYNLPLGRFRKGFNLIAPYVWGQGEIPEGGRTMPPLEDNRFTLYPTYVNVGCQTISLAEIERFAKTLNYPLDGTKAGL